MSYSFSDRSERELRSAHYDLGALFRVVLQVHDCTIITGHRNKEDQNQAYKDGMSELKWPKGNHNASPSKAVDVAPYPVKYPQRTDSPQVRFNKLKRFYYFAGIVKGIASELEIAIRWGGDWDSDNDFSDQTFNDLVHFELA